ncbi:hypothetical protein HK098_001099 [Nowakowskiella sp. JEL0407]|nr:hypothetical protein HK098_001099 [Nowakowskiella sp. JEL0407]
MLGKSIDSNLNSQAPAAAQDQMDSQSLQKIAPNPYLLLSAISGTLSALFYPRDTATSLARRACFHVLNRTKYGCLQILDTDGKEYTFGDEKSEMKGRITVLKDYFWVRLIVYSAMGFGEGYIYGEVVLEGIAEIPQIFILNRELYSDMNVMGSVNKIFNYIIHSPISNTISNALTNIQAHYDLGNEFFASFLDPTMTYSCPIWDTEHPETDTLEKAQLRKIHTMIDTANVQSTDHVLEIGTGWGALSMECVKRTGCRVTTLTLSIEQKILAEERIKKAGLSHKIDVLLVDYRDLDPKKDQFDKILTVEMLEAVGREYLPKFFECMNLLLKPQGILVFQVITMPDNRYVNYLRKTDYIQKHIFPGAHCPSVTALVDAIYQGTNGQLIVDNLLNIGPHYAKALRLWREEFIKHYDRVVVETGLGHIYTQEFKRKWEFYFAYCEAGFATRTLGDIQVRLVRESNKLLLEGIPL